MSALGAILTAVALSVVKRIQWMAKSFLELGAPVVEVELRKVSSSSSELGSPVQERCYLSIRISLSAVHHTWLRYQDTVPTTRDEP